MDAVCEKMIANTCWETWHMDTMAEPRKKPPYDVYKYCDHYEYAVANYVCNGRVLLPPKQCHVRRLARPTQQRRARYRTRTNKQRQIPFARMERRLFCNDI